MSLSVSPCLDRALWDATVDELAGHPQQLWGWGETKADHGWSADRVLVTEVDLEPEGSVTFPAIDPQQWRETAREDHDAEGDVSAYAFVSYARRV